MRTIPSATAASDVASSARRVSVTSPSRTASGVKSVADISYRDQVTRVLRVGLEPLAQSGDVGVDRAAAGVGLAAGHAPDGCLQLLARKRTARIAGQYQEKLEFGRGELHVAAAAAWLAPL